MTPRSSLSCAQVDNISEAIRQYENSGCIVKRQSPSECAMIECPSNSVYVCQTRAVSISPHDEIDEAADAFWYEEPQ